MELNKVICPSCTGNGYIRASWEGDEIIMQCETCSSQGDITRNRYNAFKRLQNNKQRKQSVKEEREWALAAAMAQDHDEMHEED